MDATHVQLRVVVLVDVASQLSLYNQLRYDTRCYFNVRSKADLSQLNLPHVGLNDNKKV